MIRITMRYGVIILAHLVLSNCGARLHQDTRSSTSRTSQNSVQARLSNISEPQTFGVWLNADSAFALKKHEAECNDSTAAKNDPMIISQEESLALDEASAEEMAQCAQQVGGTVTVKRISGNQRTVNLVASDVLAVKITGNQNKLFLDLKPVSPALAFALDGGTSDNGTTDGGTTDGTTDGGGGSPDDGMSGSGTTDNDTGAGGDSDGDVAGEDSSNDDSTNNGGTESDTTSGGDDTTTEPARPQIRAVCLILAGNKSEAEVSISSFSLLNFVYVARGNQASTSLNVAKDARVEAISVDMKGHLPSFSVFGEGAYACPSLTSSSRHANIDCTAR